MRNGLNDSEIRRATRLLRGGEAWDDIREQFDAPPEVVDRYRADLERRAARPGATERLPTPEESEKNSHDWRHSDQLFRRSAHRGIRVLRAFRGR